MSKIHHMAGNREAGKHVIFIHGFGGNYRETWSCAKDKNVFWPEWLAENESDVCIWTIEYESKVAYFIDDAMALKDRAANIAENLFIKKRVKNRRNNFNRAQYGWAHNKASHQNSRRP